MPRRESSNCNPRVKMRAIRTAISFRSTLHHVAPNSLRTTAPARCYRLARRAPAWSNANPALALNCFAKTAARLPQSLRSRPREFPNAAIVSHLEDLCARIALWNSRMFGNSRRATSRWTARRRPQPDVLCSAARVSMKSAWILFVPGTRRQG